MMINPLKALCLGTLVCSLTLNAVLAAPDDSAPAFAADPTVTQRTEVTPVQGAATPALESAPVSAAPAPATETSAAPAVSTPVSPVPDEHGFYEGGPVYVSDENRIWTRSGPGTQYRITGSRSIGDELKFLSYSQNGEYVRLEDEEGKVVWMDLSTVQSEKCGYPLEEELRREIASLQERLENYDSDLARELNAAKTRLERLETENRGMSEAIAQKDETIARLDEMRRDYADKLETKELDMQMRWWMQGALIALAGAVVGIIFLYIPRPRRKSRRERF